MIFRFIKQITAPTVFSKGIAQYHQSQYAIARQLLIKAGQWMPSLNSDPLYQATLLLCDHHLGQQTSTHQAQTILEALLASPHKDTDNYARIISDVRQIIE